MLPYKRDISKKNFRPFKANKSKVSFVTINKRHCGLRDFPQDGGGIQVALPAS